MKQKKMIYIVAHTHWDREWYFTESTSKILLEKLFNDINKYEDIKFTLDGQSSLLESFNDSNDHDYIGEKFRKKISDGTITIGPLYTQSDTFNTLFGTTQNNIDIGTQTVKEFANLTSTVYMPDSFGFNEQLPQIFKKNGFENFVAWRGIKVDDIKNSNLLNWVGIDGTKIRTSIMADGYYILGNDYPYNLPIDKMKKGIEKFKRALIKQVKVLESRSKQNVYWIPLGGDQSPYEYNLNHILEIINKNNSEYEFVLAKHDDYFKVIKHGKLPEINYPLYYSGTSKIHRSIHSNRYDIKKLFRTIEIKLYYQMEQLEIMYKSYGGEILSQKFKNDAFYKPLLKSSAHDSLGGCNSDITNSIILARLNKVNQAVLSYMDSMLRDIKENVNIKKNQYLIINPAPFKQDLLFTDIFSTIDSKELSTSSSDTKLVTVNTRNLSFSHYEPVFNHKVAIEAKNMEPFSLRIVDINTHSNVIHNSNILSFENETLTIKHQGKEIKFKVLIEDDLGDEYDFSSDDSCVSYYMDIFKISKERKNNDLVVINCNLKSSKNSKLKFKLSLIKNNVKAMLEISLENHLKNKRISLVFEKSKAQLSRHLAMVNQKMDNIPNWKSLGYKDKVVNTFSNDGFVGLDNNLGIFTKGTNEVTFTNENTLLTLARFIGYLGKPDLNYRPGSASGVPFSVKTPDAQLGKKFLFNIGFSFDKSIQKLNEWYFEGLGYQSNPINPINKLFDKFVWNESKLSINTLNNVALIDHKNLLIGQYKLRNNDISIVTCNPISDNWEKYKPYEIKYDVHKLNDYKI